MDKEVVGLTSGLDETTLKSVVESMYNDHVDKLSAWDTVSLALLLLVSKSTTSTKRAFYIALSKKSSLGITTVFSAVSTGVFTTTAKWGVSTSSRLKI